MGNEKGAASEAEENQRCVVCEPMRRVSGRREGSAESG